MIEVLMLLAVFATNILKPISKALEDYDGLMSLAELIVEGLFLFFVLKEFKMTRKSFEWQNEEWRNRKDDEATKRINMIARALAIEYLNGTFFPNGNLDKKKEEIVELYIKRDKQREKDRHRYEKTHTRSRSKEEIFLGKEIAKSIKRLEDEYIPLHMEDFKQGYVKKVNKGKEVSSGEIDILKHIHARVFMNQFTINCSLNYFFHCIMHSYFGSDLGNGDRVAKHSEYLFRYYNTILNENFFLHRYN